MSHKASNRVWGSTLSTTDLIVALALADICDDHGRGIYPSIEYAAWKSNLSERTVQRVISKFVNAGILEIVRGPGRSRPTEYRMMLDSILIKPDWIAKADRDQDAESPSESACEATQDDHIPGPDDGMAEDAKAADRAEPQPEKKGDSLSPFPGEPAEKLSTKGDSRGTKGDSRGIKGDRACHPNRLSHEPRERTALSNSIFRCPPGFKISDELRVEISRGLSLTPAEIDKEIDKFRIYPFERKVPDWSAKLCVWMARADEYKQKHGSPPVIEAGQVEPLATDPDPDAVMLCEDPPAIGETVKHYAQRIDSARTNLRQAIGLARQLGIDGELPGETLDQFNARIGTAQLEKLGADAR